jgi:hypothetical protein
LPLCTTVQPLHTRLTKRFGPLFLKQHCDRARILGASSRNSWRSGRR